MNKNKRELRRIIAEKAAQLPAQYTLHRCSYEMKGAELIDRGVLVDAFGVDVDAKKTYLMPGEQKVPVNHFKRMLKIGKRDGAAGVVDYFHRVVRMTLEQPSHIGGIKMGVHNG